MRSLPSYFSTLSATHSLKSPFFFFHSFLITSTHLSHKHSNTSPLPMATTSLQSLHHHHSLLKRHHSSDTTTTLPSSCAFSSSTHFLKLTTNTTPSLSFKLFSSSTTSTPSTTTTTTPTLPFDLLQKHLSSKNFRDADEETRRLLIELAGEAAQKRGYVFFSEVQFISESDFKTIDGLWRQYSDNKFGYSVQKRIWEKSAMDFTKFFVKVGWMKKLDTEIVQFNYRAFPNEFIWELEDDTPEGHLPLTNALRGTQLLKCIFTHPAFQTEEEEGSGGAEGKGSDGAKRQGSTGFGKVFKTDYSF